VLVHEAFVKLSAEHSSRWSDEHHFRAVAAMAMRRVLADHAKSRRRLKRGGGRVMVTLGEGNEGPAATAPGGGPDLAEIDDLLRELEADCPRVAQLVIYRFFGDMDVASAAQRLGVSVSTAEADWRFARAWLRQRLGGSIV
jgi:RNA polymerase sigma factor (TIGR02999 family)